MTHPHPMRTAVVAILAGSALALTGCAGPASNSPNASAAPVEITYMTWSDATATAQATKLIAAFQAENPNIKVTVDANPGGADGDNLVKTRLATGEMSDVFQYNSGSLLQALNPTSTLLDLSGESWAANVDDNFKASVTSGKGMYGAPTGTVQAGGIIYSKKIYDKLGLKVPTTWAEFMDNNKAIKAAGITPVFQAYGDSWTSQLIVLADYANVASSDPAWASSYTANKRTFSTSPAFDSFQHLQDLHDAGYFNKDFASAKNDNAIKALADGTAAQYPMLTQVALPNLKQNFPAALNDFGIFPVPPTDAANEALTLWEPNALYIPKSTTGAKLDAAKKFVAFFNSDKGCALQNETEPGGPYAISSCKLPSTVAPMVTDVQTWVTKSKAGPALEFLSPVKGPNLASILVEVGSGITPAKTAAAAYDQDVKKQAQQLGLPGW